VEFCQSGIDWLYRYTTNRWLVNDQMLLSNADAAGDQVGPGGPFDGNRPDKNRPFVDDRFWPQSRHSSA
jgi:hypothetical protein